MGCGSSTEVKTDPITGQKTTTHKMGGAFPGNRRPVNAPYRPPASEFSGNNVTSHFVSYGGGNALVLKQGSGPAVPQTGASAKQPEYISVTLPDGVKAGQRIQVAAPDGRLNEIIIPEGFGPGSTFTVEFAEGDTTPPSNYSNNNNNSKPSYGSPYGTTATATSTEAYSYGNPSSAAPVTATAQPLQPPPAQQGNDADDGFATGFGSGSNNYSSYPSATDARPVYR